MGAGGYVSQNWSKLVNQLQQGPHQKIPVAGGRGLLSPAGDHASEIDSYVTIVISPETKLRNPSPNVQLASQDLPPVVLSLGHVRSRVSSLDMSISPIQLGVVTVDLKLNRIETNSIEQPSCRTRMRIVRRVVC